MLWYDNHNEYGMGRGMIYALVIIVGIGMIWLIGIVGSILLSRYRGYMNTKKQEISDFYTMDKITGTHPNPNLNPNLTSLQPSTAIIIPTITKGGYTTSTNPNLNPNQIIPRKNSIINNNNKLILNSPKINQLQQKNQRLYPSGNTTNQDIGTAVNPSQSEFTTTKRLPSDRRKSLQSLLKSSIQLQPQLQPKNPNTEQSSDLNPDYIPMNES
jgi:hypothetical protein